MERKIDSQERKSLIAFHRKECNSRICDRIKAVLTYDDGYNYSDITRLVLLDDETDKLIAHLKEKTSLVLLLKAHLCSATASAG
jgi:hypothetical protein